MMWNNNDTKYIIKRLILYFLITGIVFFAGQKCANASTLAPATLQYYKPDRVNAWTRSPVNNNLLNENYYNTSVSNPNDIRAIYGIANNQISGSLFSFSLLKGQPVPTISAKIQFVDASWYNCDIETDVQDYADGSIYVAKCDLSGTGSKQVYKYGFEWSDSAGYYMSENSVYISKINAFTDANAYTSYINNVNNNINTVNTQLTDIKYQNERIISAEEDTKNAINNMNDNIMADYNGPSNADIDAINSLDGLFTNEDQDVIRGILLFPTRLFIILASALDSNSCITYSFGYLLGTEIYLPCLNYKSLIGNNLYNIIDIVFGLCVLYGLVRYIIHLYDFIFSVGLKGGVVVAAVEVFK